MELVKFEGNTPVIPDSFAQTYFMKLNMYKQLDKELSELKENLYQAMGEKGFKKIESDKVSITYVAPSDSETFKRADFQKAHPELIEEMAKFTKVSSKKGHVVITEK